MQDESTFHDVLPLGYINGTTSRTTNAPPTTVNAVSEEIFKHLLEFLMD